MNRVYSCKDYEINIKIALIYIIAIIDITDIIIALSFSSYELKVHSDFSPYRPKTSLSAQLISNWFRSSSNIGRSRLSNRTE